MKENAPPSTQEVMQFSGVSFQLYPDTEFDIASELARLERWRSTGECMKPTEIGRMSVDKELIESIERFLGTGYEYTPTEDPDQLSTDEDIARYASGLEEAEFIDNNEARGQIGAIWKSFRDMVDADIARLPAELNARKYINYISFGQYTTQSEATHFDGYHDDKIRYLVTITGPTTTFYTGNFPEALFDPESNTLVEEHQVPDTAVPDTVPLLSVVRFLPGCDPHTPPEPAVDGGQFRIFIDSTVIIDLPKTVTVIEPAA